MVKRFINNIRIALCGIGGYGETYLNCILEHGAARGCQLVAAIDPYVEGSPRRLELEQRNVRLFHRLEEFFESDSCDLVVISSPIHFHCEQVCEALRNGAHVLCEKPLCATEREVEKMDQLQQTTGNTVTIGYQWSFDPGIRKLKHDCMSGIFGRPLRLRTLVCWPRGEAYYRRNNWAGAIRDSHGRWILDSPVSNAAGHFLHNMFYVLGARRDQNVWPAMVEAHLFRANPIPNYDTAAIKITTEDGVDLQFYASHAGCLSVGPIFTYEFENATVYYDDMQKEMKALLTNGRIIPYQYPETDSFNKLWSAVSSARDGTPSPCGIEAAWAHVRCVDLIQQTRAGILTFPDKMIIFEKTGVPRRYVQGLQEILTESYNQGSPERLLQFCSRAKAKWPPPPRDFDLTDRDCGSGTKLRNQ